MTTNVYYDISRGISVGRQFNWTRKWSSVCVCVDSGESTIFVVVFFLAIGGISVARDNRCINVSRRQSKSASCRNFQICGIRFSTIFDEWDSVIIDSGQTIRQYEMLCVSRSKRFDEHTREHRLLCIFHSCCVQAFPSISLRRLRALPTWITNRYYCADNDMFRVSLPVSRCGWWSWWWRDNCVVYAEINKFKKKTTEKRNVKRSQYHWNTSYAICVYRSGLELLFVSCYVFNLSSSPCVCARKLCEPFFVHILRVGALKHEFRAQYVYSWSLFFLFLFSVADFASSVFSWIFDVRLSNTFP